MRVTTTVNFSDFEPWSGAVDTLNTIRDLGMIDEFESYAEEIFGDTVDETKINDFLWFDSSDIYDHLAQCAPEMSVTEVDMNAYLEAHYKDAEFDSSIEDLTMDANDWFSYRGIHTLYNDDGDLIRLSAAKAIQLWEEDTDGITSVIADEDDE